MISLEKIQDYLTCPLCLERYNRTSREPKSLPCLHSFCRACLEQLFHTNSFLDSASDLSCPQCRYRVWSNTDASENLPTNFMLVSIMDALEEEEMTTTVTCAMHDGRACRIMCTECDVGLCDACLVCPSKHKEHAHDEVRHRVNIGQELKQSLLSRTAELRSDLRQVQAVKDAELQKKSTDIKHKIAQTAEEFIEQIEKWQKDMEAKVDAAENKMREKTGQDIYQMFNAVAMEQTITDIPDYKVKDISKITKDLNQVKRQIASVDQQLTVFKITEEATIKLGDLEYHQEEKPTFEGYDTPTIQKTNIKAISHGSNNIMIQTKESLFTFDFLPSHHYKQLEKSSLGIKHQSGQKLVMLMCPDGYTVIASKLGRIDGSTMTTTWVSNKTDFQGAKDYTGEYGELIAVSNERLLYLSSPDTLSVYAIAWHTHMYDIHAEGVCNAVMHPVSHRVAAEFLAEELVLYHAHGAKQEIQLLETSCSLQCCCSTLLVFMSPEHLVHLYSWSGLPLWKLDTLRGGDLCIYHMTCTDDQVLHMVIQDDCDDDGEVGKMMVLPYNLAQDTVIERSGDCEKLREIAFASVF